MSNFMKISLVEAELFSAHGWADRMTKLRVALRNFAKEPNKCINSQVSAVRCDTDKVGLPTFVKPSPRTGHKPEKGTNRERKTCEIQNKGYYWYRMS